MTYRATNESSELSASERFQEATKILAQMGLENQTDRMTAKESKFVIEMVARCSMDDAPVSVKQLWWLRDLKDKYLL